MKFRNPDNGHIERRFEPWLWAFIFGGFYFLVGGHWTHFVVWIVLTVGTWAVHPGFGMVMSIGLAIVYAGCANSIVRGSYLRDGWVEVPDEGWENVSAPPVTDSRKCPFCAEEIKAEAIKCRHCGSAVEPISIPAHAEVSKEAVRTESLMETLGITREGDSYLFEGRTFPSFAAVEEFIRSN